jgi:hypothetical protein
VADEGLYSQSGHSSFPGFRMPRSPQGHVNRGGMLSIGVEFYDRTTGQSTRATVQTNDDDAVSPDKRRRDAWLQRIKRKHVHTPKPQLHLRVYFKLLDDLFRPAKRDVPWKTSKRRLKIIQ